MIDPNVPLYTQLHKAIRDDDVPRVSALLRAGADANGWDAPDAARPLLSALVRADLSMESRLEIVEILLKAGADPMLCGRNFKFNSLTLAAERKDSWRYFDLFFKYSTHKIDPNQPDDEGTLPLRLCTHEEDIRMLIRHGADVLRVDNSGQNALEDFRDHKPYLLSAALWEGIVAPHVKDGKLDVSALIVDGESTPAMKILQEYGIPLELTYPDNYKNGMDDLAVIYEHLPLSLKHHVDLSSYHEKRIENTPDETHIGRYERKKPTQREFP